VKAATTAWDLWEPYYETLPYRLVELSRCLQNDSMRLLKETYGHRELRLHFEPFIHLLGVEGCRLTELAERLSITKQACNQTSDKLEQLGYIERRADVRDGRAKLLMLTSRGRRLIDDGVRVALALDESCVQHIGRVAVQDVQKGLRQLVNRLGILRYRIPIRKEVLQTTEALLMLLPRLGDHTFRQWHAETNRLMGSEVKSSHLEWLGALGHVDGQLRHLALLQEMTRAVVMLQAREMATLGYLQLLPGESAGSWGAVSLTATGERLRKAMVTAAQRLEQVWRQDLGDEVFEPFQDGLGRLYQSFVAARKNNLWQHRVEQLASQLRGQLNIEECRALGALLLSER